MTNSKGIK